MAITYGRDFDENKLEFRPMIPKDVEKVGRLERKVFSRPWPERAFLNDILSDRPVFYRVCYGEDSLLGYLGAHIEDEKMHIVNMAVEPSWQRCGIGGELLKRALDFARKKSIAEIYLEVRRSNQAAISLYKKYGFEEDSIRRSYYARSGEDAIIMVRGMADNE